MISCLSLVGKKDVPPSAVTRPICGIMGTIRLVAGTFFCDMISPYLWHLYSDTVVTDLSHHAGMYLIVITRKRNVGSLLGHAVWKAVDFDVISYKKTVLHLSEIQVSQIHALVTVIAHTHCCRFSLFPGDGVFIQQEHLEPEAYCLSSEKTKQRKVCWHHSRKHFTKLTPSTVVVSVCHLNTSVIFLSPQFILSLTAWAEKCNTYLALPLHAHTAEKLKYPLKCCKPAQFVVLLRLHQRSTRVKASKIQRSRSCDLTKHGLSHVTDHHISVIPWHNLFKLSKSCMFTWIQRQTDRAMSVKIELDDLTEHFLARTQDIHFIC